MMGAILCRLGLHDRETWGRLWYDDATGARSWQTIGQDFCKRCGK